jgi:nitrogen fixation/metabolism regulation signal transduction histidine kinase
MRHRARLAAGVAVLAILVTLVIWQGSFTFGDLGPATLAQTYIFWALSTLIFLLTVVLGFMLFRTAVKMYIEHRANREGSRIRTKIVVGALALTFTPVLFLVIWSVEVLNRNLDKWFSRPAEGVRLNLVEIGESIQLESERVGELLAHWVADAEATRQFLATGQRPNEFFRSLCATPGVAAIHLERKDGGQILICEKLNGDREFDGPELVSRAPLATGEVAVVRTRQPVDLQRSQQEIQRHVRDYEALRISRRETRVFYLLLLLLITLFILFVANWIALFLARQITGPVTALLGAAREVRGGNLAHRVKVAAIDEFASLVRAFNEMTQDLEANRDELERRRRFIETVLESIPTGVASLSHDARIQLSNRAMRRMFPPAPEGAGFEEWLPAELQVEIARLLKSARRLGVADRQMDLHSAQGTRVLSVTVAALDAQLTSGYVLVIEDTSELLRAQKAAAWHEVARRIAHEIKNPLTPIALSSDRIRRQLERPGIPAEIRRVLEDCSTSIAREVESVKNLVDEFSRFARFPAAQPVPLDLNEVVEEGLAAFAGRLESIEIERDLAAGLPLAALDREQFKRVVVNLVDNAAEAMRDAPLKRLYVSTVAVSPEILELIIADTGSGISVEDREKLFLPYFSTKQRGTGLGLAIVSHIVAEHGARIRVEENQPSGARFIIELPVAGQAETGARPVEVPA